MQRRNIFAEIKFSDKNVPKAISSDGFVEQIIQQIYDHQEDHVAND